MTAASLLISLLVALAGALAAAVIGAALQPRGIACANAASGKRDERGDVAERGAGEDLRNCQTLPEPSGKTWTAAGRMYAAPPSATNSLALALFGTATAAAIVGLAAHLIGALL